MPEQACSPWWPRSAPTSPWAASFATPYGRARAHRRALVLRRLARVAEDLAGASTTQTRSAGPAPRAPRAASPSRRAIAAASPPGPPTRRARTSARRGGRARRARRRRRARRSDAGSARSPSTASAVRSRPAASARPASRAGPDHADDLVAVPTQQLGEVGAVLPGDPGDERPAAAHGRSRGVTCHNGRAGSRPEPRRKPPRGPSCHRRPDRPRTSRRDFSLAAAFYRTEPCDARPPARHHRRARRDPGARPAPALPHAGDRRRARRPARAHRLRRHDGLDGRDGRRAASSGYVCVAATHTVMVCQEDPELRDAVLAAPR